jgi:DNA-binding beta-propeller fold protein YncE
MDSSSSLSNAARSVRSHPSSRRFELAPGARPAGLYLDEESSVLAIMEQGTGRISILDANDGRLLNSLPIHTTPLDIELREKTIGGELLPGEPKEAYFWSNGPAGILKRFVLDSVKASSGKALTGDIVRTDGQAFIGSSLLRDWLYDRATGRIALTARDDPLLYVIDRELRDSRVMPLEAPGANLAALPGGKMLVMIDSPEEPVVLMDLAANRFLGSVSPWSELKSFPNPPQKGPFFNSAPIVVSPDGRSAYIGSHHTDEANRSSPIVSLRMPEMILDSILSDERLVTPTRLAIHPDGLELYASGDDATLAVDTKSMEVTGELGPGRMTALVLSPSGSSAVGVDLGNTTAYLFDALSEQTLTATLTPDVDATELPSVSALISEVLGVAYVIDRFGDSVLVMPLL